MRYYLVDNSGQCHAESQDRNTLELLKDMVEVEVGEECGLEIIESEV